LLHETVERTHHGRQACNQLGTSGGAKSFPRRAQIFWTMSNIVKLCATHFSRMERKIFCSPLVTGLLADNAARQWHADSGMLRKFVLCEKKHEWVCSNASTSLENPLLVLVWPICLSVRLHLCRLLFMQY